jgi:single-strand DNA-binding protein
MTTVLRIPAAQTNLFSFNGNLGQDAERRMAGETPVINFSIAADGYDFATKSEYTTWVRCSIWGDRATEKLANALVKGKNVTVSGREIVVDQWESNGKSGFNAVFRVDQIKLNGSNGAGNGSHEPTVAGEAVPTNNIPF